MCTLLVPNGLLHIKEQSVLAEGKRTLSSDGTKSNHFSNTAVNGAKPPDLGRIILFVFSKVHKTRFH
jgi:hypothetical protein